MPEIRQEATSQDAILVRSLGLRVPSGYRIEPHQHSWHQFVYATRGVMTVESPAGTWLVPSHRAVWIPAGFVHAVETSGKVWMRTLYLRPGWASTLPGDCRTLQVSPLLRELVLEVVRRGFLRSRPVSQGRLAQVVADQVGEAPCVSPQFPLPRDPRAVRLARKLLEIPQETGGLDQLARECGASARTLERLFLRETGLTLGRWRQQARLLHSLRRLAEGASVTEAALEAGYSSTSAFIAMFKGSMGQTPGQFRLGLQDSFTPW